MNYMQPILLAVDFQYCFFAGQLSFAAAGVMLSSRNAAVVTHLPCTTVGLGITPRV
jgi:hypothetical protein